MAGRWLNSGRAGRTVHRVGRAGRRRPHLWRLPGNVEHIFTGHVFGIPTYGTQAHSWIMAHETEEEAFAQFMDVFPQHSVLLIDTYDVRGAIGKVVAMGRKPRGVRLDSGDLVADSIWAREKLDEAGWGDVEIFASGDLDEERISRLLAAGARIDTFGVGTSLTTSADAPSVGVLYKLVETERDGAVRNAAKFSAAKVTYPGRKQVFRSSDVAGHYAGDVIALEGETAPGEPLLVPGDARARSADYTCGAAQGTSAALSLADHAPSGTAARIRPCRVSVSRAPQRAAGSPAACASSASAWLALHPHRRESMVSRQLIFTEVDTQSGFHAARRKTLRARSRKIAFEAEAPDRCRASRRSISAVGRLRTRARRS